MAIIKKMERKKKITNYTIFMDSKLGEGAFGKVYVGEQDNTKLKVAVKVLEKKAGRHASTQSTVTSISRAPSSQKSRY